MRKVNAILMAICLLTIVGVNSVVAEDYKIGAVNMTRILEQSPQAISAEEIIKEEFALRDRTLVEDQKKIKLIEDRLAKDGAIMNESERKKLERDIISGRRDLKRDHDEFREDVNFRLNEERAKIQKEVFDAIIKVAKQEGYDLVLYDGVAFASPKVDFSESVISHLKNKK